MGGEQSQQKRAADAYQRTASVAAPPEQVGSFEKVGPSTPADASGPRRVAQLLIAMGPDEAAQVLSQLETDEIERVARAVMQTPSLRPAEARELLEKIGEVNESRRLRGGPEVARQMLVTAFGEDRGELLFREAVPEPAPVHFEFLADLEVHQLRNLLHDESAGAISVIIPHLPADVAGEILQGMPAGTQGEVVRRIARMGRLDRDVVVRIEDALREKIRRQGRQVTQAVDGNEKLAAILRHMAPSEETEILTALDHIDTSLAGAVRKQLYTIDLLSHVSDRALADLFREFTDPEVALFLKGKSEVLRARMLRAFSERRRVSITEEYVHQGPQKREEIDRIDREVLDRLRVLEQEGTVLVPREGDRYI